MSAAGYEEISDDAIRPVVADVIGKWRIEGRWWSDGRDREYWRVEARGGAVWDLYHDRAKDAWHMERLWD